MDGLIGHMTAMTTMAGQRNALVQILVNGVAGGREAARRMPDMPEHATQSSDVGARLQQADGLWINDVPTDPAGHQAPLQGQPLIARKHPHTETQPVSGFGIG